jgi:hypothetical protein
VKYSPLDCCIKNLLSLVVESPRGLAVEPTVTLLSQI